MKIFEEMEVGDLVDIRAYRWDIMLPLVKHGKATMELFKLHGGINFGLVVNKVHRTYGKPHTTPGREGVFLKYAYGYEIHFLVEDVTVLVQEHLLPPDLVFKIVQKKKSHGRRE